MSKICNRDYEKNGAYTVKTINGALCCPLCEKPTMLHGKPVELRALAWALSDDTGISSKSICRYMTSTHGTTGAQSSPPWDAADRGRCIRLLELVPEWIDRLSEMVQYDQNRDPGIVINASGISANQNSWEKQIPLIIKEGKL